MQIELAMPLPDARNSHLEIMLNKSWILGNSPASGSNSSNGSNRALVASVFRGCFSVWKGILASIL
ncbi:hypothetical protein [Paraburkholderia lacunae]|uniref:hypothetical protein n=1 Tax=Paraburkholderia lacunae TaxID=2211104 RepID=UPI001058477B|nr:hypothetical protein [Paraburkholderia lacunae]